MATTSRVRDWLRAAAAGAVPPLLCEVGCARLSVDDVARRLGLAKGALYFSQRDVAEVIAATLDAWTAELTDVPRLNDVSLGEACGALLRRVGGGATKRSAIPCCLAVSPCPHGWPVRWRRIAARMGFGETDLALTLGDVIQAIASHPGVRSLLDDGRVEEAVDVVLAVVGFAGEDGEQRTE